MAELYGPNVVDVDWLAARVPQRTEKLIGAGIECIDLTASNIVADQNRIAHRAEISRSLSETPG